jgi:uncharacterized protein
MKYLVSCGLLAILALVVARPCMAGEPLKEGKIRVLITTGGHDYEVPQFDAMFAAIPDIAATKVVFPAAGELLKPDLAKKYDVVVMYDMDQTMTPEQLKAFEDLVKAGIGVVSLHHNMGAHPKSDVFHKITGGKFFLEDTVVNGKTIPKSGWIHGQTMKVEVTDREHPITRGLADFTIEDEAYDKYDTDPAAKVLLKTNHPKNDPELAWVKTYGNSRVFFLMLGHDHLAYENPNFRTVLARGIRWAAGRPTQPDAKPVALFNGKDLTGWKQEGGSVWEVKDGLLVGRQGPNFAPGDLFTEKSFDDCEISLTFKATWPCNSGLWYRYQNANKAFQADILEWKNPVAWTGTLYCPGKMFLAINGDPKLVNRDGWNTIVVRAAGKRQVVFLNGTKTADVYDDTSDHGRIGFQVHPGAEFGPMRIFIKDVSIRPL